MKSLKNFHKTLFAVAVLCLSVGFASCSDDDDDPVAPGIEELMGMPGTYNGSVTVLTPRADESEQPAKDLTLVVTKDKELKFNNFPIKDIIYSLYETAEEADAVLEEIGNLEKNFSFETKEILEEEQQIKFDVDTEDIEIPLENGVIIKIALDDNEELGLYAKSENTGKITFKLSYKAEKVTPAEPEAKEDSTPTEPAKSGIYNFSFEKITK
ncbi:DUF4840 domain-containing protein [Bacteroides sp.]|uniref:DUF4840 domain-containing protein n=1 Tax=Bacteroides sp. TaxID=29523 RepID=UPI00258716BA|nr:DUF4840 domain-containing protein [Bacteroides sp.]